jgi:hypothetical protein
VLVFPFVLIEDFHSLDMACFQTLYMVAIEEAKSVDVFFIPHHLAALISHASYLL